MIPALIFDLDGTLVDTAPDLLAALNHALAGEGRPPVKPDNLRQLVGHGARVMIGEAFKLAVGPTDPEMTERMLKAFLAYYRDHVADQSRPWPGVVKTLEALRAEGARMGVLTNKPHDLSLLLLEKLQLDGHFASVFGQGRLPYMKPDPRTFEAAVLECGESSGLMIGDSQTDVATARAAGAPVILVSFGYTTVPVRELGADAVVDHFADIPAAIRQILGGRASA
jgi:phosphoglycolate phosphatase